MVEVLVVFLLGMACWSSDNAGEEQKYCSDEGQSLYIKARPQDVQC